MKIGSIVRVEKLLFVDNRTIIKVGDIGIITEIRNDTGTEPYPYTVQFNFNIFPNKQDADTNPKPSLEWSFSSNQISEIVEPNEHNNTVVELVGI